MGHYRAGTDAGLSDNGDAAYEYYYNTENPEDSDVDDLEESSAKEKEVQYIEVDTNPDSYTVLVNRDYPISKDYVPADLVVPNVSFSFYGTYEKSYVRKRAATALENLFAGAQQEGYVLKAVSAYRSYQRQTQIYNNNVKTRGEDKTNTVSAMPGTSEHQTGLAIDVSCPSEDGSLETSFGQTAEGKWLKKNCYKYGFIIRYPKDKTDITGYSYEPWHIRYVGKNLAKYLKKNKMTLEEYYKLTTVENKVQEDAVSDTDTDLTNEPQMTAAPKPKVTAVPSAKPSYTTQTAAPSVTQQEPSSTQPVVTQKPSATQKPSVAKVTKEPVKTPKSTKKPVKTAEPSSTKEPEPTKNPKPAKTPKPAATKEPAKTAEPAPTKKPEQPTPAVSADVETEE
jgi:LAS superfamily LD-carboxypeptidase LdcB